MEFEDKDLWKGIILYGLNAATYKIALGRVLLDFTNLGSATVSWPDLSKAFLDQYVERLASTPRPQQAVPQRLTTMERIVARYRRGTIDLGTAVADVGSRGFTDVIPRFQTIGTDRQVVKNHFYEYEFGKRLILKDSLLSLGSVPGGDLEAELNARWSLLEGAFMIAQENYGLANDIREIYLARGHERTPLTDNIPFLSGYQGNLCFYCGQTIFDGDAHVDHVLPRQVLCHDEVWNLVLSHSTCNLSKSDHLVADHYVRKLIARNENLMGSNHPWKRKIAQQLGSSADDRARALRGHYENVRTVVGPYYWGGAADYIPEIDPFYRKLITRLNNRRAV